MMCRDDSRAGHNRSARIVDQPEECGRRDLRIQSFAVAQARRKPRAETRTSMRCACWNPHEVRVTGRTTVVVGRPFWHGRAAAGCSEMYQPAIRVQSPVSPAVHERTEESFVKSHNEDMPLRAKRTTRFSRFGDGALNRTCGFECASRSPSRQRTDVSVMPDSGHSSISLSRLLRRRYARTSPPRPCPDEQPIARESRRRSSDRIVARGTVMSRRCLPVSFRISLRMSRAESRSPPIAR